MISECFRCPLSWWMFVKSRGWNEVERWRGWSCILNEYCESISSYCGRNLLWLSCSHWWAGSIWPLVVGAHFCDCHYVSNTFCYVHIADGDSGSWESGLSYECRSLLFKALHNLIERWVSLDGLLNHSSPVWKTKSENASIWYRISMVGSLLLSSDAACENMWSRDHRSGVMDMRSRIRWFYVYELVRFLSSSLIPSWRRKTNVRFICAGVYYLITS